MTVLWCILGAIVLLIVIVLSLRVGITLTMHESLTVTARIGPKTVVLYPAPPKKAPAKKKKTAPAAAAPKEEKKPGLDLTVQDVREAIRAAWNALERVLRRIGKGIRIYPCRVSIIAGGSQPDRVAELYGQLSAAVWTVMPRLEQLIHIRDPYIHLDADFNAPAVNVEGQVGACLRVGDLIAVAFAAAIPLLKWYIPFNRRRKARQKPAVRAAEPTTQP